jgi:hypothetical protein
MLIAVSALRCETVMAQFEDDSSYVEEDYFVDDAHLYAKPDTVQVTTRSFDEGQLSTLKADEDLQYKEPPTIAESIFDRLKQALSRFLESLFDGAIHTNWGRVFSYLIAIGLIVVVILMLLKVDAFKIFYSGRVQAAQTYSVLDENIHEMDFDKLIAEAISQNEYRRATRLVFLNALKLLADRDLIQWEMGKTNHDYLLEVKHDHLKNGLHQLNYFFEYAWYGNFNVSREKFSKVQEVFNAWRKQMQ